MNTDNAQNNYENPSEQSRATPSRLDDRKLDDQIKPDSISEIPTSDELIQTILLARDGDTFAKFKLGSHFKATEQNKIAKKWFKMSFPNLKKLAENGDGKAQSKYALMLNNGIATKRNVEKAIFWFDKAANLEIAEAQYNLAIIYLYGMEHYKKNKDEIILKMEHIDFNGPEFNKGENLLIRAASQNFREAQYVLGQLYWNGDISKKDAKLAAQYYLDAAKQGHVESQYCYGLMNFLGDGIDKNLELAAKWFREAAINGYALAQHNYGWMLFMGLYVKEDKKEAAYWYKQAALQGNAGSQLFYGRMLDNGFGVTENKLEAFEWYQKAATWYKRDALLGNAKSQLIYGHILDNGFGVTENKAEAFECYLKAAIQNQVDAQYRIANMLYSGQGTAENRIEAAKWFEKAAELGNVDSMFFLANMNRVGDGITENINEAAKWYYQAAKHGHVIALNNLSGWYFEGKVVNKNIYNTYLLLKIVQTFPINSTFDLTPEYFDDICNRLKKLLTPLQIQKAESFAADWEIGTPLPLDQFNEDDFKPLSCSRYIT